MTRSAARSSLSGSIRPDDDPDPVEPLECDRAGVERYAGWFEPSDVSWGTLEADGDSGVALALRIDATASERGETASIRLTNVADRVVNTGNNQKYSVEVYTESGSSWREESGSIGV